jgi:hypothetical protein
MKVIVAGGAIGGITTALALQVKGIDGPGLTAQARTLISRHSKKP